MSTQKPMPMWLARLTLAGILALVLLALASVFQEAATPW